MILDLIHIVLTDTNDDTADTLSYPGLQMTIWLITYARSVFLYFVAVLSTV